MKKGDVVEALNPKGHRRYNKRGKVLGVSLNLVMVRFTGEDYEFTLTDDQLRVVSAVELLAEKAE